MRLISTLLLGLAVTAFAATCQAQQLARDEVATLNARYQSVQLQLQQQRIDNELARLQLEYAQLINETRRVNTAVTPLQKPANMANETVLSDVTYPHVRLQILAGEKRRWRATPRLSGSPL